MARPPAPHYVAPPNGMCDDVAISHRLLIALGSHCQRPAAGVGENAANGFKSHFSADARGTGHQPAAPCPITSNAGGGCAQAAGPADGEGKAVEGAQITEAA